MTYKEALDVLRRGIRCNSDDCPPVDCKECEYSVTDEEWNEAFTKALEALEEQEDGAFGSMACTNVQKAGISESTRQAILNVLDDFADETLEIRHGAYEKARYAMCRLLEG